MSVNRRSFLKYGVSCALTAAFGLAFAAPPALGQGKAVRKQPPAPTSRTAPQVPFSAQQSPLFYFTQETFRPYVGGIFVARSGSSSARMTLAAVSACTPGPTTKLTLGAAPPTECFILTFTSPDRLSDLKSIYDIRHGALGEFPLFLTRRDGPNRTQLYEAVFNRAL
jgi:hypothetical protein